MEKILILHVPSRRYPSPGGNQVIIQAPCGDLSRTPEGFPRLVIRNGPAKEETCITSRL